MVVVGKVPVSAVDVAVSVPLATCTRLGVEPMVAVTVRVNVVVWVAEVPVPVTVTE